MSLLSKIKGGVFGVATGDALGVPFEFKSRAEMRATPAKDMVGYGTYGVPAGTWSDDSSLTFCLMEGLIQGYDLKTIGHQFVQWLYKSYWTPRGTVFDVGMATRMAIARLEQGYTPELCGGMGEYDNGNGSLMRILPMIFYLNNEEDIDERFKMVKDISSLTHAHLRSVLACFIYVEYGLLLLQGLEKVEAYKKMQKEVISFLKHQDFNPKEINMYYDVLEEDVSAINEDRILGSGYVVQSLKASLWSFLNTTSYDQAVLKAVNFGQDTDTTAAITGGLAGLYYGFDAIPELWKFQLARYDDIENLISRFNECLS